MHVLKQFINSNPKIYLAAPWFTEKEWYAYRKIVLRLRDYYHLDVFVPQEHVVPNGESMSNAAWGKAVFDMDIEAINNCDVMLVLNFGINSDTGTAWEAGYAYGLGKPVYQILCDEDNNNIYSLMCLNGCEDYKYELEFFLNMYTTREPQQK